MDGSTFTPVQQKEVLESACPLPPATVEWVAVRSGDSALIIPFPVQAQDD